MKTYRMIILSLSALAFFLIPANSFGGPSDVRFRASVRTPHVRIDVNNGISYGMVHGDRNHRNHRNFRDYQDQRSHRLTRHDRKIAKRLARYTGVSKKRLLDYRARGYGWSAIGRWLDLPRQVVRAARSDESWRHFLRSPRRCGTMIR